MLDSTLPDMDNVEPTPEVDPKAGFLKTLQDSGQKIMDQFEIHAGSYGLENIDMHREAITAWLGQVLGFAYVHDMNTFRLESGMVDIPFIKPDGGEGNHIVWSARLVYNTEVVFATSVSFSFKYGSQG